MAESELENINSSSAEEEDLSSQGSDTESEPEKKPPPPPSPGESESDADSPQKKSEKTDPKIKPLASKPMDDEPLLKPKPKNTMKSVTGKRKVSEAEIESMEPKKPMFQRLWSEDDEIELIKGMINYVETKGKIPMADVNDFHEFVKSSLHIDVNNGQMSAKIKRLKTKFMNNVGKIELNGKVRSLSNPHEKKMYELSNKLWGSESNKNAAIVSCSKKKVNAKPKTNQRPKNSNSMFSGEANVKVAFEVEIDEGIMNKGLELALGSMNVESVEKLNNLKVQELMHFLKKVELMKEQAELVLSAIKKSGWLPS